MLARTYFLLELTGIVAEHRCAETDTGCVTSYGLSVIAIAPLAP